MSLHRAIYWNWWRRQASFNWRICFVTQRRDVHKWLTLIMWLQCIFMQRYVRRHHIVYKWRWYAAHHTQNWNSNFNKKIANLLSRLQVYNAPKLIEYCYGFLLQNMVALLTYDDSVKRLLFAKKIPNNDVLNGLLQTLQLRIKQRRSVQNPGNNAIRPPVMPSVNKMMNNK